MKKQESNNKSASFSVKVMAGILAALMLAGTVFAVISYIIL